MYIPTFHTPCLNLSLGSIQWTNIFGPKCYLPLWIIIKKDTFSNGAKKFLILSNHQKYWFIGLDLILGSDMVCFWNFYKIMLGNHIFLCIYRWIQWWIYFWFTILGRFQKIFGYAKPGYDDSPISSASTSSNPWGYLTPSRAVFRWPNPCRNTSTLWKLFTDAELSIVNLLFVLEIILQREDIFFYIINCYVEC